MSAGPRHDQRIPMPHRRLLTWDEICTRQTLLVQMTGFYATQFEAAQELACLHAMQAIAKTTQENQHG
jgi:hypothetical protein